MGRQSHLTTNWRDGTTRRRPIALSLTRGAECESLVSGRVCGARGCQAESAQQTGEVAGIGHESAMNERHRGAVGGRMAREFRLVGRARESIKTSAQGDRLGHSD